MLLALEHGIFTIRNIKNPTEKVYLHAVKISPEGFMNSMAERVQNNMELPPHKFFEMAVSSDPDSIRILPGISKKCQKIAVSKDPNTIRHIPHQSYELQLDAVKNDIWAIRYIPQKEQYPEVQKYAIKSSPETIKWIDDPSEELQFIAVKEDINSIQHIRNLNVDVLWYALKRNSYSVLHWYNASHSFNQRLEKMFENNPELKEFFFYKQEEKDKETGKLNEEVFDYNDLNDEEKENVYNIFKSSYEKSVGTSWDQMKFQSRAKNWKFYGDRNSGFVVLRKQNSGMNKLTGVAGDLKSISLGINDINNINEPVWGMADKKIVHMLTKRYGFYTPPAFVLKLMMKHIPSSVFGDAEHVVNDDGSVTFKYSDVGDATKYFFANKQYYAQIYPMITKNLTNVPSLVVGVIKNFFKLFI
jgi:hypothetical protein